jgi:hypothetical protein
MHIKQNFFAALIISMSKLLLPVRWSWENQVNFTQSLENCAGLFRCGIACLGRIIPIPQQDTHCGRPDLSRKTCEEHFICERVSECVGFSYDPGEADKNTTLAISGSFITFLSFNWDRNHKMARNLCQGLEGCLWSVSPRCPQHDSPLIAVSLIHGRKAAEYLFPYWVAYLFVVTIKHNTICTDLTPICAI